MEQYLIDTNVISDYFSGSLPQSGLQFMDSVINFVPNLSVITQIELLCWKTGMDK
jgi:predicted nucleic acid-binding protein